MLISMLLAAHANEGMWLPEQLPELATPLREAGYQGDPRALAKLDRGPLAAIVDLGGCSGAFVSDSGLIATAYHCIGNAMGHASERDENLFETGFYAPSQELERWAGPTVSVRVTVSMEDVTDEVLGAVKRHSGAERARRLDNHKRALVKRCERPGIVCKVVAFDDGATYELIAQQEFKDVRVVYSPPRPVGYYGGNDDNWQWPRHSGDFAFLRAYADADNQPTGYRADNRPFQPAAHLPTAAQGPGAGDFVMVGGYPAGTYRWKPAAELDYARDADYPRRIATFDDVLTIMRRHAQDDPRVASTIGSRILSLNNQMQYLEGNLSAFRRIRANERKWRFETELSRWIAEDESRRARYGTLLDGMRRLQAEEASTATRDHVAQQFPRHSVMFDVAMKLYRLALETDKRDSERAAGFRDRDRPRFADELDAVDARYAFRVDMELTRYFLDRLLRLPEGMRVPELDNWFAAQRGDTYDERLDRAVDQLYTAGSGLSDASRRRALMDTSAWYLDRSGNPWFELTAALAPFYERLEEANAARQARWAELRPVYLEAVEAFTPVYQRSTGDAPRPFYPDANATLRVSFGRVEGFAPRDGLLATPHTTLPGILEKAGEPPYDAPLELIAAIEKQRWGPYATGDAVRVNYLSTADTTLGSSGSATIDAKGRFCGVLFDGNYESMATDWVFEESVTRSIHTDVAYILWYLDAIAGADALLRELGHTPALSPGSSARRD